MDEGEGLRSKTEVYEAHDNGSQAVVQGLPRGACMATEGPQEYFSLRGEQNEK